MDRLFSCLHKRWIKQIHATIFSRSEININLSCSFEQSFRFSLEETTIENKTSSILFLHPDIGLAERGVVKRGKINFITQFSLKNPHGLRYNIPRVSYFEAVLCLAQFRLLVIPVTTIPPVSSIQRYAGTFAKRIGHDFVSNEFLARFSLPSGNLSSKKLRRVSSASRSLFTRLRNGNETEIRSVPINYYRISKYDNVASSRDRIILRFDILMHSGRFRR